MYASTFGKKIKDEEKDPCESSDEEKVKVKLTPRRREAKKVRKEKKSVLREK